MIGIIDYGLGNVRAFSNIYDGLNIRSRLVSCQADFEGVERVILPGVGAFDHAMDRLEQSGLLPALKRIVLAEKRPVLGVCVGMQILANGSEEGTRPGLGWVDGTVRKMTFAPTNGGGLPHMGWNTIQTEDRPLFTGLDDDFGFYFLHSFYFECADDHSEIAVANYGQPFACAVANDNVFGVQFHPEKSHHNGVQLLRNFAESV